MFIVIVIAIVFGFIIIAIVILMNLIHIVTIFVFIIVLIIALFVLDHFISHPPLIQALTGAVVTGKLDARDGRRGQNHCAHLTLTRIVLQFLYICILSV